MTPTSPLSPLSHISKVNPLSCRLGEVFEAAKDHKDSYEIYCAVDFPAPLEPGTAQLEYVPAQKFPHPSIPSFLFGERLHGVLTQWKPEAPNPDSPFDPGGEFHTVGSIAISTDRSVSLVVNGASTRFVCRCMGFTLIGTASDGSQYTLALELNMKAK